MDGGVEESDGKGRGWRRRLGAWRRAGWMEDGRIGNGATGVTWKLCYL